MTPSKHDREVTGGRPPFGERGGSGNKSLMISHFASEMNGGGAVLDPVLLDRRCVGRPNRVMTIAEVSFRTEDFSNHLANQ
jgi:hypothetical protein